jgi:MoxR-like ATPase
MINTDDLLGGKYLQSVFVKPSSVMYNDANSTGKIRAFTDKDYTVTVDGVDEQCRFSTEWMSIDLNERNGSSNNYLRALIEIANKYYADYIKIYEESGVWYIEYLKKEFVLSNLPDVFSNSFAKRFITSLIAKPFVILTGNSGTGKTRICKQFAEYLEVMSPDNEKNWVLVPVGADWTDNTKILGFYNPLANEGKGSYEKTEILKLIENANKHKDKPYFIILDEMNLSHVERYFADFLSHMETEDIPFVLDGYKSRVEYPKNLFVVGTVNIDETTYMFSPKVLDRANVIEFKPDEESVLDLFMRPASNNSVNPANDGTAEAFLRLSASVRSDVCELETGVLDQVKNLFSQIYHITEKYGFEFAFRTVKEIRHYIVAANELIDDNNFDLIVAEDEQLLQKILPKIHGNKKELGQLLDELGNLCDQNGLTQSYEKIQQMKGKLASVQYASFI